MFHDFDYYLDTATIVDLNNVALFLEIEKAMLFSFEANLDYLGKPTSENIELFFKNQNATLIFLTSINSLKFFSGIVEEYQRDAFRMNVEIEKKVQIMQHKVNVLDFMHHVPSYRKIEDYCLLLDSMLKVKEGDYGQMEAMFSKCMESYCRKYKFDTVPLLVRRMHMFMQMKQKDSANKALDDITYIIETHQGINHACNPPVFELIGDTFEAFGLTEYAFEFYFTASRIIEKVIGKEHLSRVAVLKKIGKTCLQMDYSEKTSLAKEVMEEVRDGNVGAGDLGAERHGAHYAVCDPRQ